MSISSSVYYYENKFYNYTKDLGVGQYNEGMQVLLRHTPARLIQFDATCYIYVVLDINVDLFYFYNYTPCTGCFGNILKELKDVALLCELITYVAESTKRRTGSREDGGSSQKKVEYYYSSSSISLLL